MPEEDGDQDVENLGEAEQALPSYCDDVLSWNSKWASFESQVLTLVNQQRTAGASCAGVPQPAQPALTFDDRLRCSSRKHSMDMGVNNFVSHTGSDGSLPWDRMTSAGYVWTYAAENIAAGQTTPADAVNDWMASPGHCLNIMRADGKDFGMGYYSKPKATYKHYWTLNIGSQ